MLPPECRDVHTSVTSILCFLCQVALYPVLLPGEALLMLQRLCLRYSLLHSFSQAPKGEFRSPSSPGLNVSALTPDGLHVSLFPRLPSELTEAGNLISFYFEPLTPSTVPGT